MNGLLVAALLAQQALFLVRHAEKADNSKDAVLSQQGEARAKKLASILRDVGITAIFTTEFQRTKQTAQPTADATKIAPRVHPAKDTAGLVKLLRAEKRALVVGHSNTLPEIAKAYGLPMPDIGDDEYDGLYVLIPGSKALIHLHQE
jgi:phosphohistidine phosphatase SixA